MAVIEPVAPMLYTARLKQFYAGENVYTTINYWNDNSTESLGSETISDWVVAHLLTSLNAAQNQNVQNVSLYVWNQTTGENSYFTNLGGGGDRSISPASAASPAFLTATFSFNLYGDTYVDAYTKEIKRGSFHMSGLLDGDFTENHLEADFASNFLGDIEADWCAAVTIGEDLFYPAVHVNSNNANLWRVRKILSFKGVRLGTMNTRKTHLS